MWRVSCATTRMIRRLRISVWITLTTCRWRTESSAPYCSGGAIVLQKILSSTTHSCWKGRIRGCPRPKNEWRSVSTKKQKWMVQCSIDARTTRRIIQRCPFLFQRWTTATALTAGWIPCIRRLAHPACPVNQLSVLLYKEWAWTC